MATAFRDVERLLDGPIEFSRDWRTRERRKRNQTIRFVLWAAVASLYVTAMRLHGLHKVPLGPLLAGVLRDRPDRRSGPRDRGQHAVDRELGGVLLHRRRGGDGAALRARCQAFLGRRIPAILITLIGLSLTDSFTGWCTAIPDRDIAVAGPGTSSTWSTSCSSAAALTNQGAARRALADGRCRRFDVLLAACDYVATRDRVAALVLVVAAPHFTEPWPRSPAASRSGSSSRRPGGCSSSSSPTTGGRTDRGRRRRLLPIPQSAPRPPPAGAHAVRLRRRGERRPGLALDWPQPLTLSADLVPCSTTARATRSSSWRPAQLAFRVAALTAVLLFSTFIIIAGWFGTFAAFTYREFAERAVTYAERASR